MPGALDVRRFTAIDMHGAAGTPRRRRLICAEFVIGCPLLLLAAAVTIRAGHGLFGWWLLGVAVNYVPLAVYAATFYPRERMEAELADTDAARDLRRAGTFQLLLLVPLVVAATAAQAVQRRL